jgi:UDP-N-acetylglucosamine 2-epimerase (non-hydrolysing)
MIYFFVGTKAQFIKMAPVMVECEQRGLAYRYVDSGQHAELTARLRRAFNIRNPDFCFGNGRDVASVFRAVTWTLTLLGYACFRHRTLRRNVFPEPGICLVHGDTLSTVLGMLMAKAAGLKVGHVEAGLRSFSLLHPFPEELIRLYCMRRCDELFAPSSSAEMNLRNLRVQGRIHRVEGNTVSDALRLIGRVPTTVQMPDVPFVLACCHRIETISNRDRLGEVVQLLNCFAQRMHVVLVLHKPTRRQLKRFNLESAIGPNITVYDMLDYMDFVALMKAAKAVLADGGSIQEECAYLGKPCLILRMRTERPDGVGKNAWLWKFDASVRDAFLIRLEQPLSEIRQASFTPSSQIADTLASESGLQ